mmetsp:Transcript_16434/g.44097  ORF Transcript_16434/g.44097 Transcript_16434/m.44097 type:complete len:271 (+) Transcript_16434:509-1321(+)
MRHVADEAVLVECVDEEGQVAGVPVSENVVLEGEEFEVFGGEEGGGAVEGEGIEAFNVDFEEGDGGVGEVEELEVAVDGVEGDFDGVGGGGRISGVDVERARHVAAAGCGDGDGGGRVVHALVDRGEWGSRGEGRAKRVFDVCDVGVDVESVAAKRGVTFPEFSRVAGLEGFIAEVLAARGLRWNARGAEVFRVVCEGGGAMFSEKCGVPVRIKFEGMIALVETHVDEDVVGGDLRVQPGVGLDEAIALAATLERTHGVQRGEDGSELIV